MSRTFNITADCKPSLHYMVDITDRLEQIKKMIDAGQYFTINRARQYGKTTTLRALAKYLAQDYVVVSLDFQLMSQKDGGHLNMRKVLEKFVETFDYLYGDQNESFLEEAGRRYFMLFLKPIINGIGNCYVEPETRNRERMDLVVDYRGEQFVVEMKIWHGDAYNKRGEKQIAEYLEYYGLKKGYMISFNFNKKKEIGVKEIIVGDKVLIEAVV